MLQQVGSPQDVYAHPANLFVAQFVGSPVMNIAATRSPKGPAARRALRSRAHGDGFAFPRNCWHARRRPAPASELSLGIRPEGVLVSRDMRRPGFLPVEAHIIEPLGSYDIVDLKVGEQMLRARTAPVSSARPATASLPGSIRRRRTSSTPRAPRSASGWRVTDGPHPARKHHQDVRQAHRRCEEPDLEVAPTASSSCCSARPAPARRRRCADRRARQADRGAAS
jgi:hypothetical protein